MTKTKYILYSKPRGVGYVFTTVNDIDYVVVRVWDNDSERHEYIGGYHKKHARKLWNSLVDQGFANKGSHL